MILQMQVISIKSYDDDITLSAKLSNFNNRVNKKKY